MSSDPEDRIICFCHNVLLSRLVEAIRAGARTHEELQEITLASTGCTGCTPEVLEILEKELAVLKKQAGGKNGDSG